MREFNETNITEITQLLGEATRNVERVYDAGYSVGRAEGGYGVGFDAGVKSEYDRFWDEYQKNGIAQSYEAAFAGPGWNDKTFTPKYPLVVTYAYNMFYGSGISDGYEYLKNADFSKCTFMNNAFAQCHIKHIGVVDCSSCSLLGSTFAHVRNLETIDKIIVNKNHTFTGAFTFNLYLREVRFEGEIGNDLELAGKYSGKPWGENLSNASITNIIEHLSDEVSEKKLTLSKTAVDREFYFTTEVEGNLIEIVGSADDNPYWHPLIATKPNWTITLV